MKDLKLASMKSHNCLEALDDLQREIIMTLFQLEMYFSSSFFDIMVHLIVHLVREIKICGPTFLRSMYPFERFMGFLKGYVRNRFRPQGSIIESYSAEEVIGFYIEHLPHLEQIGVPNLVMRTDSMACVQLDSKQ